MLRFASERPILSGAILVIVVVLAFIIFTPNYSNLGFEEVKELDGMFKRGGKLVTNSILASAGLETEFVSYEDIGWDDSVTVKVKDKKIKGTYFGYNTQDGCHYLYLNDLLMGKSVYKIDELDCEICED